jgi:hypothetical protein
MSGCLDERMFSHDQVSPKCPHNVVRRKRGEEPCLYVCGSCAALFTVEEYRKPVERREQMFDRRPPWGLRNRQA